MKTHEYEIEKLENSVDAMMDEFEALDYTSEEAQTLSSKIKATEIRIARMMDCDRRGVSYYEEREAWQEKQSKKKERTVAAIKKQVVEEAKSAIPPVVKKAPPKSVPPVERAPTQPTRVEAYEPKGFFARLLYILFGAKV